MISGGPGTDWLSESGDVNFVLTNSLLTGLGTDSLNTIESAWLIGGDGNNKIDAAAFTVGMVRLVGGKGNDYLIGGSNADELYGGEGNDILVGRDGDDKLYGESGVDVLFGEAGADYLDGGGDGSRDTLYGGTGGDTFIEHGTWDRRFVYDPASMTWRWVSIYTPEDDFLDFNTAEDRRVF